MLTAVNFHYIRERFDMPYPGIHGVTPKEFENQIDLLAQAFVFVSGTDISNAILGRTKLPCNALVVTFDDGLREQYDLAWPILQRKGIPVIFYVSTAPIAEQRVCDVHQLHMIRSQIPSADMVEDFKRFVSQRGIIVPENVENLAKKQYLYDDAKTAVLKYMLNFVLTEDDRQIFINNWFSTLFPEEKKVASALYMDETIIAELGQHNCIGCHSHNHKPLGRMSRSQVENEIERSLAYLKTWGVREVQGVSYPYGGRTACSEVVAKVAREYGISFGFTMERARNYNLNFTMFLARLSNSDLPGGNAPLWTIEQLPDALPSTTWNFGNEL